LPDNEAIREAVEAGAGATIISEHVVASAIAGGTLRANPIDLPPRDFVIVEHRNRHASTAQLFLVNHLMSAHDTTSWKRPQ
jgi:DNA-binding transcriptional LysR family regulator